MMSFLNNILAVLVGVWAGFRLSQSQISLDAKNNLIRSIALEYKRLHDKRDSMGIAGLIRSGIHQLKGNKDVLNLIELIENFGLSNPIPNTLNLAKNKYFEFFQIVKLRKLDGLNPLSLVEIVKSF